MRTIVSRPILVALSVAVTITLVSGLSHGWLDARWVDKPNVKVIGEKLNDLPKRFGEWSLIENQKLPESAAAMLQCYGYALQVYQNDKTGRRVNVAVLLGPRGPIAVHTPEVCYSGRGVTASGKTTKVQVKLGSQIHTIWRVGFKSKVDSRPSLEAYYAWSDGGNWQAAENPRMWFTSRLYKIQLACQPTQDGEVSDAVLFLRQFIPELQPLLVKSS